jgi:prepilin-type N-terminal cleavage/methylation domain-containing protein
MKKKEFKRKLPVNGSFQWSRGGRESAFTLIETLMSIAVFSLVITGSYYIFNYFSQKIPGLNEEIAVQRVYRTADQLLEKRLSQAVEIIEPAPVKTLDYIKFKEIDGRIITLKGGGGVLATYDQAGNLEKATEDFYPIYIKNVDSVDFTALSYSSLMVKIKFKNSGEKDFNGAIFVVRFKNANSTM